MSAGDDLVRFNDPTEWEQIINRTYTAVPTGKDSYVPIGQVDLFVALDAPVIVFLAIPIVGKPTWRYAGEIRQVWDFPKGGSVGGGFSTAQSKPTQVFIKKPQIVRFNRSKEGLFRLRYHPPTWFKQVAVFGWKYTGEIENFTKDTLFEIGNKIGIGTLDEESSLSNQLLAVTETLANIQERLDAIESSPPSPIDSVTLDDVELDRISSVLVENVVEVKRDISDLTSDISSVLSGEKDPETLASETVTFLEDEFI